MFLVFKLVQYSAQIAVYGVAYKSEYSYCTCTCALKVHDCCTRCIFFLFLFSSVWIRKRASSSLSFNPEPFLRSHARASLFSSALKCQSPTTDASRASSTTRY